MGQIKYLHCIIDDKFIDGAISLFETVLPNSSDYVFVKLKLTKKRDFKKVKSEKVKMVSEADFVNLANKYDVVILHSYFSLTPRLICSIPINIKVVWFAWGYDLYHPRIVPINLYYDCTAKLVHCDYSLKGLLLTFRSYIRNGISFKKSLIRIDYFSGVFPYEYDLLKKYKPYIKAKPLDFYYGSNDFFVPEKLDRAVHNKFLNVIIGNSNTYENNHLDAFHYMKNLRLVGKGKVIIPLSYPKDNKYKDRVKRMANSIWGEDHVMVLDHYLPLTDYLNIVSNCKVAVYFHERQQASDNVLMQLMYGAKVFMSETSLMYRYLKSLGFYIYSLQEDSEGINEPLCNEHIMHNRELLSNNFSSSKLLERVKVIDDIIAADILQSR